MIDVNGKKLCEYCFSEVTGNVCSHCRYVSGNFSMDNTLLKIGAILENRYLIGGLLGKGGFGITYLAYDMKLDCKVAIKEYYPVGMVNRQVGNPMVTVMKSDAVNTFRDGARKFYDEAKLVAQFNGNPNIVNVSDFFYANNTAYFVMGYVKGQTLKSFLLENGVLSKEQSVRIIQDITNALQAAHGMKVLHRDISPDNIMLCTDGTIKLLDFGAARAVSNTMQQNMSVVLKQGFAPLEQYQRQGNQGPWTDIYSLGATIYYSMTGKVLKDPMSRMEDDSKFLSNEYGIPSDIWNIIKKCLELKPEDRYHNVDALRVDLQNLEVKPASFHVKAASLSSDQYNCSRQSGMPGQTGNSMRTGMPGQTGNPMRTGMPEQTGNSMRTGMPGQTGNSMRTGMPGQTGNTANGYVTAPAKKGNGNKVLVGVSIGVGSVLVLILGVVMAIGLFGGNSSANIASYKEYTNDVALFSIDYDPSFTVEEVEDDTVYISNGNDFEATVQYVCSLGGNGFVYSAEDFANMVETNEDKIYDFIGDVTLGEKTTATVNGETAYVYNYSDGEVDSVLYVCEGQGDFGCYTIDFGMSPKNKSKGTYDKTIEAMVNSFEVQGAYEQPGYELVELEGINSKCILQSSMKNVTAYASDVAIYPVDGVFVEGNIWISCNDYGRDNSVEDVIQQNVESWISISDDGKATSDVKEFEYGRYPIYGQSFEIDSDDMTQYCWSCIIVTPDCYWKLDMQSTDEYEEEILQCCDDIFNSFVDLNHESGMKKE